MDCERHHGLGLEPVLATSELAEHLGVQAQAIYNLRTDGRGPFGIRVGREIRYCGSDVVRWRDGLHEPAPAASGRANCRRLWASRTYRHKIH
jgi:predicted DNA-binding transcriptional regulator AlpA